MTRNYRSLTAQSADGREEKGVERERGKNRGKRGGHKNSPVGLAEGKGKCAMLKSSEPREKCVSLSLSVQFMIQLGSSVSLGCFGAA